MAAAVEDDWESAVGALSIVSASRAPRGFGNHLGNMLLSAHLSRSKPCPFIFDMVLGLEFGTNLCVVP